MDPPFTVLLPGPTRLGATSSPGGLLVELPSLMESCLIQSDGAELHSSRWPGGSVGGWVGGGTNKQKKTSWLPWGVHCMPLLQSAAPFGCPPGPENPSLVSLQSDRGTYKLPDILEAPAPDSQLGMPRGNVARWSAKATHLAPAWDRMPAKSPNLGPGVEGRRQPSLETCWPESI